MKNSKSNKFKWINGGLAGSTATLFTHPLDLLKVRLQLSKKLKSLEFIKNNKLSCISSEIIKYEGVYGFYKGLSASISRQLVYTSIRFGLYEYLTSKYTKIKNKKNISIIPQILSACISGIIGGLFGNIFDIINIRMQSDYILPIKERRNYKHVFNGFFKIIKYEGINAYFIGISANLQRAVLMTTSQIVTYSRTKSFLLSKGFYDNQHTHFLSSMVSGLLAVTVSNPVDVIKSRLMSSPKNKFKSAFHCFKYIFDNYGIFGFYKGWIPSYIRLGPHTIITFMSLEQFNRMFI